MLASFAPPILFFQHTVDVEPNLPVVRWLLSIISTKQWILMKMSRIDAMKREMEGKAAWGHRRL
ncbi:hypothetical protein SLEP1_g40348 [Rubroshorea leprosula]|uniref:Uncharacterized protein n=1 Tax=Rubroshorea leprosula TaxID=152421 RepID=A0AAV5L346_9ROSI|nr:hypothetical protein SLEP1_g40348 [Rubroshorea leprosula]